MKKLLYIFLLSCFVLSIHAQDICCPDFRLQTNIRSCQNSDRNDGQEKERMIVGCKNSLQDYIVIPNIPGYILTWDVTGGTPVSQTGNPMQIEWGSNPQGNKIKIYIESEDGLCKDTLEYYVILEDAPIADFEFSPDSPVCKNQLVSFNNTSVGATGYYWDFGDGNSSTKTNPTHSYAEPGTYTVTLTTYKKALKEKPDGPAGEQESECGCTDTVSYTIVVLPEEALTIESSCNVMLCEGDTAIYYTPDDCDSYSWSVTGGAIIGSTNGKEITVVWNGTFPATVTLDGDCNSSCGNTATIQVPVLYSTMDIEGADKVCIQSMASYSLPSMPGTFYNWTIAGSNFIIGPSVNTSSIEVQWGYIPGKYLIKCEYNNPHTGCGGSATIEVNVTPPFNLYGLLQYCVDSPFNFSSSGDASWTISPNTGFNPSTFANGSSVSGTWTTAGEYIIEATTTDPDSYCNETAQLKVQVFEKPQISSVIGADSICPGGTSVYSVSSNINGGFFHWTVYQGNIVSYMGTNNDSIAVEWGSNGPYSLQVIQYVNGCQSDPYVISPEAHDVPDIDGPEISCMDEVVTYTTSASASSSGYNWSLSNALGTIISGQGTNTIEVLWHGSQTNNTTVLSLTTCGGTATQNITVNMPPALSISKSGSICDPQGISLTASISGASTYNWFLDDNLLPAPQNTQTISITLAGTYKVEVTDVNGCNSKASIVVPKENLNLTATVSAQNKFIWNCDEDVNTILHAIPSSSEYCYQWFRSNTPTDPGVPISGATSYNYTATSPGHYWAEISICNTSCLELTNRQMVKKLSCDSIPCEIEVDFTFTECNPVAFTATTFPPEEITGAHWYFGDGNQASGINVTHQYLDTAIYHVCVEIFADSCYKYICKDVEVNIAANFSAEVNCDEVTFTNLSKSRYPATYSWSFPGGSPSVSNQQTPPVVTYATSGVHTVSLTITDGNCTLTYQDTVRTYSASAEMHIPDPICVNTDAPFTAVSDNPDLTYSWNFGDGYISSLQNATHAYQNSGTYTVTLTVTEVNGCSKVYSENITVNPAPVVNIGNDVWICENDSVSIFAPAGFESYQWYRNGNPIANATNQTCFVNNHGEYWVEVASEGGGCVAQSNHIQVYLHQKPIASIMGNRLVCSDNIPLYVQNMANNPNCQYNWSITGPESGVFQYGNTNSSAMIDIPNKTPGNYEIVLTVTDQSNGCRATDTLCVLVSQSPVLTVEAPEGNLCEGEVYTFIAHAEPILTSGAYTYAWSNGFIGDTLRTGKPGYISVTAVSPHGCMTTQYIGSIKRLPDVSLAPAGCDTLCVTDTIWLPLPKPNPMGYNVNWYDDTGTEIINVGNNEMLPLSGLHPGIHHLYAEVSYPGSCVATTGKYDLYVKDCDLEEPCDNCVDLLRSVEVSKSDYIETTANATILHYNITFTIEKEVREVRLSLSDLQYSWNDSTCTDCDIQAIERGCIFTESNSIGALQYQGGTISGSGSNECPQELIWKGDSPLMPGTYTVSVQVSVSAPASEDCRIFVESTCFHLTLIDSDCLTCENIVCAEGDSPYIPGSGDNDEDCGCSASGEWTSLYLIPQKPGIPKPRTPILCNTVIENIVTNTNYVLSGLYHCVGECVSVRNEIVVYNQQNQIIYTREAATLNEIISFPAPGAYTVVLTATCDEKKCVCEFRINVVDNIGDVSEDETPPAGDDPTDGDDGDDLYPPDLPGKIDDFVNKTIPKDFNGSILVAKKDSVIYEKYVSYKDEVNEHTAFDIASVTKPFTAAAILKLSEEGKLNIDDPVNKFLSKFPYPEITVRMLLTHRSGLMDYLHFIDGSGWNKSVNVTNNDLLDILADNKSKVLINKPGTVYSYSNTNYSLLALIIEKVSGNSYGNYLDINFFMPLGMKDTYVVDINNFARATPSYYRNGTEYKLRYLDLIYGDKCVYSTTQDLRKWDTALRGGKVLKQSTLDEAYKTVGQSIAFNSSYTMGWKKVTSSSGKEFLYHDGWWAGNRALLIRLIEEDVVIAVLSNNNFTTIKEIRKMVDLFGNYQMSTKKVPNF